MRKMLLPAGFETLVDQLALFLYLNFLISYLFETEKKLLIVSLH